MKKIILPLLLGSFVILACQKEALTPSEPPAKPCLSQTVDPSGQSYPKDSVISWKCTENHCGLLPLSGSNYWIYLDSVYQNGVFKRIQFDTLRFTSSWKSLKDGLVWWESKISVGLPDLLYSNQSGIYKLENRMFNDEITDAKKEFSLFQGDSTRYLASFEDIAAQGRSQKVQTEIRTPAGTFNGCLYFDKNARNFRRDQVYFAPGIGVVKYTREEAPMGTPVVRLQQISTLVKYHIE